jgi:NAD+ diphosphatase
LAGFVETGESLEDGVKREAFEEVGIEIETKNVFYHSSQPWPFPQSLMIGFMVEAQKCEIKLTDEIEDAQWFSKEQILNQAVILPPSTSISRRLINEFVQDKQ